MVYITPESLIGNPVYHVIAVMFVWHVIPPSPISSLIIFYNVFLIELYILQNPQGYSLH